ncbi:MAG TPA: hypothetical protein VGA53_03620 [Candidatus Paceibacterota bacterium]
MVAIKAEDLQCFVGGQLVRVDSERQFQGPIKEISDGDSGEVRIMCTWEAEFDPNKNRCKVHNGSSVAHVLDLSYGGLMIGDSEFYYNPHTCAKGKGSECAAVEHLMRTYHLYSSGSAMEIRIAGVKQRRFIIKAGVVGAGVAVGAFIAGMITQARREKTEKESQK